MRLSFAVVVVSCVASLALAQESPKLTDTVAWGSAVNGLRLGIVFGSDLSKPTLRIVFQNVGSAVQEVLIGHEAGRPLYDSMKFIATDPNGKQQEGFHINVFSPLAGRVLPISVRLNAGAVHELEVLLNDITYSYRTVSYRTLTLETLVKQGYSVRVRFEANQSDADAAGLLHSWVGTLSSAEISPAR